MTTDARAVIARIPRLALAADRREMTLWDLAAALPAPSGNTAAFWHAPTAEPPPAAEPPAADSRTAGTVPPAGGSGAAPGLRFDREVRAVLEQALLVALQERVEHIGTEHLLAALLRTGPPDVVAWLAAHSATAEAVDALLARLRGGPGVERLPAKPSRADRRNWRRATARVRGGQRTPHPLATVAVVLTVMVVFVLCVWGP
ncbi:Clp protease N-terminal domain-containing protein [Micromonospora globispora]|nr:Clp protease N-terminal domain-containing protein [Micromonospora globispora]